MAGIPVIPEELSESMRFNEAKPRRLIWLNPLAGSAGFEPPPKYGIPQCPLSMSLLQPWRRKFKRLYTGILR